MRPRESWWLIDCFCRDDGPWTVLGTAFDMYAKDFPCVRCENPMVVIRKETGDGPRQPALTTTRTHHQDIRPRADIL